MGDEYSMYSTMFVEDVVKRDTFDRSGVELMTIS